MNRSGPGALAAVVVLTVAATVAVACGAGGARPATQRMAAPTGSTATTTTVAPSTTPAVVTTTVPATATTGATPPARPSTTSAVPVPSTTTNGTVPAIAVGTVTAADLGGSWHPGCPVGPSQLRRLTIPYWGFDGRVHQGQLVVNAAAVPAMGAVFARLFAARFPIHKMVTIDHYPGSGVQLDDESTADDNTAAFNCRNAVNPGGTPSWSEHAFGEAIDVNPVENPYVESNGVVDPPAGAAYVNRSVHRTGMAYAGSVLNAAFAAVGWGWGGYWGANPDYQHFSVNGQ
ncbi:MAG TPA: M15 family metallopeptidase [Acidimicrobiales bacterium]|nr:M15 family metallopeptidase [Acidimicrobiales bacterium]